MSQRTKSQLGSAVAVAMLAVAGALLIGCAADVHERNVVVADEPVVVASSVPAEIETYPQVYYKGSVAYYVGNRWYWRTHAGFVTFRREPVELVRYRTAFRAPARVY